MEKIQQNTPPEIQQLSRIHGTPNLVSSNEDRTIFTFEGDGQKIDIVNQGIVFQRLMYSPEVNGFALTAPERVGNGAAVEGDWVAVKHSETTPVYPFGETRPLPTTDFISKYSQSEVLDDIIAELPTISDLTEMVSASIAFTQQTKDVDNSFWYIPPNEAELLQQNRAVTDSTAMMIDHLRSNRPSSIIESVQPDNIQSRVNHYPPKERLKRLNQLFKSLNWVLKSTLKLDNLKSLITKHSLESQYPEIMDLQLYSLTVFWIHKVLTAAIDPDSEVFTQDYPGTNFIQPRYWNKEGDGQFIVDKLGNLGSNYPIASLSLRTATTLFRCANRESLSSLEFNTSTFDQILSQWLGQIKTSISPDNSRGYVAAETMILLGTLSDLIVDLEYSYNAESNLEDTWIGNSPELQIKATCSRICAILKRLNGEG